MISSNGNGVTYMHMTISSCVRKDLVEGSRRKVTTASLAAKAKYEGIEKDGRRTMPTLFPLLYRQAAA